MKLKFPLHTLYFAPDNGGDGGGTAVAEPPAGAGEGDFDILNYQPPAVGEIGEFLKGEDGDGKTPPKGEVKKPDPKPAAAEKQPEGQKPEEKPPQKTQPDGKEPAAQLRARLKELEGEKTRLETDRTRLEGELTAAKSDKRAEELQAKLEEREKVIAANEKALADAEQKLLVHNPLVSRKLTELENQFNKDFESTAELVPQLKREYRALLDQFAALPHGKDDYPEKLREFRQELRDKYDDDERLVLDAVRKGYQFRGQHAQMAQEISRDAHRLEFEGKATDWRKNSEALEKEWDSYFTPPADAESTDPYNHALFLKKFESQLPADEVTKMDSNLKAFVNRVFNGAQPRTKADFPGMDDASIQKELSAIESRVAKDRADAKRILAVGGKALAYLRPIIADWQRLRARLADKNDAAPPDPTKQDGVKERGNNGDMDDLLENMPSPSEIARSVGSR